MAITIPGGKAKLGLYRAELSTDDSDELTFFSHRAVGIADQRIDVIPGGRLKIVDL